MSFDPFELLNLPHRYSIDRQTLRQAFLQRSSQFHPDASQGDHDQDEERIAALNRAHAVLLDPELRAQALLSVLLRTFGVTLTSADERALPEGFLQEMLEQREHVDAAIASRDPAQLNTWEHWAEQRRLAHQRVINELFESCNQSTGSNPAATLKLVKRELNAWRYIERLVAQLHA